MTLFRLMTYTQQGASRPGRRHLRGEVNPGQDEYWNDSTRTGISSKVNKRRRHTREGVQFTQTTARHDIQLADVRLPRCMCSPLSSQDSPLFSVSSPSVLPSLVGILAAPPATSVTRTRASVAHSEWPTRATAET